jgi:hypothetical protein
MQCLALSFFEVMAASQIRYWRAGAICSALPLEAKGSRE